MILNIGLATDVETIVVAKGIHGHIIGIVAGTQGVDIILLHHHHILLHLPSRHGATSHGVGVVAVDALEEHAAIVDIKQGVAYLHTANAMLGGEGHLLTTSLVILHHMDGVELRGLGSP